MRTILGLAAALLAAAPLTAGCGGARPGDGDPLAGTAWVLGDLAGKAVPAEIVVTARFRDGRVGGRAGCNEYFAPYEARGDSLRLGHAGTTKMMCPPPQMETERAFLAALAQVRTFRLAGDRLELHGTDGLILAFTGATDAAP